MMRYRAALILAVFFSSIAFGEMSAMTVKAKVKTFTEKTVTVVVNKKQVEVPRKLVNKKKLQAGDAVVLTLRGDEINYLLGPNSRTPASQ